MESLHQRLSPSGSSRVERRAELTALPAIAVCYGDDLGEAPDAQLLRRSTTTRGETTNTL